MFCTRLHRTLEKNTGIYLGDYPQQNGIQALKAVTQSTQQPPILHPDANRRTRKEAAANRR